MHAFVKFTKFAFVFSLYAVFFNASAETQNSVPPSSAKADASTATPNAGPGTVTVAEIEASIRDMMELDKFKDISYRDEKGAVLTSDQFYNLVASGWSFHTNKKLSGNVPISAELSIVSKETTSKPQAATYKIKRGDKFPSFRLKQVDGHFADNKQLNGRYSLVNFYFAQCGPCVKEIPDLNALASHHKDMNFLAVTFDPSSDTKEFVADRKFDWKVLPDAKKLIAKVGVHVYPSFALVDPNGVVLATAERSDIVASDENVENWVTRLIAKPTLMPN